MVKENPVLSDYDVIKTHRDLKLGNKFENPELLRCHKNPQGFETSIIIICMDICTLCHKNPQGFETLQQCLQKREHLNVIKTHRDLKPGDDVLANVVSIMS